VRTTEGFLPHHDRRRPYINGTNRISAARAHACFNDLQRGVRRKQEIEWREEVILQEFGEQASQFKES